MHGRPELTNAIVLAELAKFDGNVNTVRKRLNCSYRLVHDVKNGRRKDPKPFKNPQPPKPPEDPCTCCGFREKAYEHRYLCEVCFTEQGDALDEHRLTITLPAGV